ncbi:hypothetical protein VIM7927_03529 [Vibrio mangrovi]|uniref:Uncharacterized protein n=1 Tax=Vibrio mangrovi TaxID=474394 RepID=A0A1Y6IYV9_9VIBR|nr:hypothetical protein VIM7927_03529 [Vibrio mangrovi]
MQTNGRAFTDGKQTLNPGFTLRIGFDTTHGVVNRWTDWDWLFDRIDVDIGFGQLTDKRQTFMQIFSTQMAQIQMNDITQRMFDGVAFLLLVPECLRDFIARTKLHIFVLRLTDRCFRSHTVVLKITVAVFIDDNTAFTTTAFGHQNTGAGQAGRVILNKLHIPERNTMAISHTHTVSGHNATVGITLVNPASATGRQNDGFCFNSDQFTFRHVNGNQSLDDAVIDQQINDEILIKTFDLRILYRRLEEGMQHVKTGFVCSKPGSFNFHTAETTDVNFTVFFPAPGAAPLLHLDHFPG